MNQQLDTDYLIIGAGAMGLAFADEMLTQRPDVRIILVDRRAKPGGHWVDAYRFVTLHQPAAYYGVNSEPLGAGGADLASGSKILAYYERVMDKLVASGQVRFFMQCEYEGEGRFRSLMVAEQNYSVTIHRKTVDASYSQVQVPSTHPPRYAVADGVHVVPINGLADIQKPWSRHVVIGAGKTGMDAVLYLLGRGVDPDCITWIISNDAWYIDRAYAMPKTAARTFPTQLRCMVGLKEADDFFRTWEAEDWLFRLDESIWPTKFRCATVNRDELRELRRISHVVRMGRVVRIEPTRIVLEQGTIETGSHVLHVDCTADGLVRRPPRPVFDGDLITLQPMVMCQQVFSSALIAVMEVGDGDDESRNSIARLVPHPEFPHEYFSAAVATFRNLESWVVRYGGWMLRKRLSLLHHVSWFDRLYLVFGLVRWGRLAVETTERIEATLQASRSMDTGESQGSDQ